MEKIDQHIREILASKKAIPEDKLTTLLIQSGIIDEKGKLTKLFPNGFHDKNK